MSDILVFFPPRLITVKVGGDHNKTLDNARDSYLDEGIMILGDEDSIKDAQKVCNFYRSFKGILPPE